MTFRFTLKPGRSIVYVPGIDKNIGAAGYETDKQKDVAACAACEGLILAGSDMEAKVREDERRKDKFRASVVVAPEPVPVVEPKPEPQETPRTQEIRHQHKLKKGK